MCRAFPILFGAIIIVIFGFMTIPSLATDDCQNLESYLERLSTAKVDIVFVFDTTKSMGEEIREMQSISKSFADGLVARRIDYCLGLTAFKDFPINCGYGKNAQACGYSSDFPYKIYNDGVLTDNSYTFKSWLGYLSASGGGNDPESILAAMRYSAVETEWRENGAGKIIVLITDAAPHPDESCCNVEGDTLESVISELTAFGIKVYVIGPQNASLEKLAIETGGKLYPIRSGLTLQPILEDIAGEIVCSFDVVPEVNYGEERLDVQVELRGKEERAIPFVAGRTNVWMYMKYTNGTSSRYGLEYDRSKGAYCATVEPICGQIELTVYGKVCNWSAVDMVDIDCGTCPEKVPVEYVAIEGAVIVVPDDFSTIQAAIDAADPGDTIEVHSGTYYENVEVDKQLTLRGVDTGAGMPVVDAGGKGSAIELSEDGIWLEGFVATNSELKSIRAGIDVNSDNNTIIGNDASNNGGNGIFLWRSSNNTISRNIASNNENEGIKLLSNCNNNLISDNDVNNNGGDGLNLYESSNNSISGNNARNNGDSSICLVTNCSNTYISDNDASNNGYDGIRLIESSDNFIVSNTALNNDNDGISLGSNSSENQLSGNILEGNRGYFGDAYDRGINNLWDNGSIGNYYGNFECTDADGDGICDSEHDISGGQSVDRYPLASPLS